ncbi:MAG: tetratricopeptide repeat protein [Gammaproteobacteria bacterium]|nr:tetratricopeptide repeat protein [Gammaproteobacteria bacterium]
MENLPIWAAAIVVVVGVIALAWFLRRWSRGSRMKALELGVPGFVKTVFEMDKPATIAPPPPVRRSGDYVHRGAIEDRLLATLQRGNHAAIVGVSGMGGVGKSALARYLQEQWEQQQPGSTLWVTLSERPVESVQQDLAVGIGVEFPANAQSAEARHGILVGAWPQRITLVVLDDIRRVLIPELRHLLPPCAVLLTSRQQQLGPRVPSVEPLDCMNDAEALASLRGEAQGDARVAAAVDADPDAAQRLIVACAHHPLALRLARARLAAHLRTGTLTLPGFLDQLHRRLDQLATGDDAEQNLRSNFDLSLAELDPDTQRAFQMLAIFAPTGFGTDGAAALWGVDDTDARVRVQRLTDASLVEALPDGRHRLHDLLHEFALDRLRAGPEADTAYRRLVDFLVDLFDSRHLLRADDRTICLAEMPNLYHAWSLATERGAGNDLARLTTASGNWMATVERPYPVWEAHLGEALRLRIHDPGIGANAALHSYQDALQLYRDVGDRLGEANTLRAIGDLQQFRDDRDAALHSYQDALQLFRDVGDRLGEANVRLELARMGTDIESARGHYQAALASYRAIDDRYSLARGLAFAGQIECEIGDRALARTLLDEAVALFREIGLADAADQVDGWCR